MKKLNIQLQKQTISAASKRQLDNKWTFELSQEVVRCGLTDEEIAELIFNSADVKGCYE
jgi:hypothetical protein